MAPMLKYLRIAVTALSLTACVLLIALWVRSYSWSDWANCPLRSPSMLIVNSFDGRLSLYAGERVPYRTGFFPSGWDYDSYSVAQIAPSSLKRARPYWDCSFDQYGWYILFPYWLPVLTTAVIGAGFGLRKQWRFSLRTLLIATTLVAVALGVIVAAT
jgi:hypothetical protein